MLIKDIITEQKDKTLPKVSQAGAVHAVRFDDLDTYYRMYRFGMAMADPHSSSHPLGPAQDTFSVWMYTDQEAEIVARGEKTFGTKGTTIVKGPSRETENINITSPVARPKRNKYGV